MTFKELKKWYKKNKQGFYLVEHLREAHPDVLEAFEKELKENTGRVGCYVYHYHTLINDELIFEGIGVGYYVRSRNPFSWKFKRTHGNY
jgi:hypothetical protein